MNVHEYQAKALLKAFGVSVPKGRVAYTPEEALDAANTLSSGKVVVKAQIHAGGRGKAGGIKLADSPESAAEIARELLGKVLVTPQTGPTGRKASRVYVEAATTIAREMYLAVLIDRTIGRPAIIASTEGGMDIERVAADMPEAIATIGIDPATGLCDHHIRRLALALDVPAKVLSPMLLGIYAAFVEKDAELVEINPLIVTEEGDLVALDAKMSFDDNALYRHKDIESLRDSSEEDPIERTAAAQGLSYVKLDGHIGCMVNGAGLAMATMDIIKLMGGAPANFLDVGGGASRERVTAAMKLILADPAVEGVLVNIFGGIMRCDVLAQGLIDAAREVALEVPLVVRLEGTNVEIGKHLLAESGLPVIAADDLADAARNIVTATRETA
ncbi:MAG: ADP-forming succinate--CoA ligase subunit beta [Pseudomonadota bacterium]|nr:ADP-forming succinate--CoA ligase subunit beta [Pseudomonadota bacterium]